jgi:DNA-directed RNA polymerase specialized sigma24 family protein
MIEVSGAEMIAEASQHYYEAGAGGGVEADRAGQFATPSREGPWQSWEYRVLHGGQDAHATALLLDRRVEEVVRRLDLSFDDWYARRRCPGSPMRPDCILRIGRRLYEEDGHWRSITDGELEAILLDQTRACLKNFDPTKWRMDVTDEEKFVRYFVVCLRRKLKSARRRARVERGECVGLPVAIPDTRGGGGQGRTWAGRLLRTALARLQPRARKFIEYRYLEGLELPEVAAKLGVAAQTLYNSYSLTKVASLVRDAVSEMVRALPPEEAAALAQHLHHQEGFNERAIAELLCLPRTEVDRLLDLPVDSNAAGRDVVALLDGPAPREKNSSPRRGPTCVEARANPR